MDENKTVVNADESPKRPARPSVKVKTIIKVMAMILGSIMGMVLFVLGLRVYNEPGGYDNLMFIGILFGLGFMIAGILVLLVMAFFIINYL